jgi:hypothetical protein
MMTKLVNREKAVKGTALSFAVMGTIMHGLNIVHATNSSLSQVWSVVAIIGFFLTMSHFVNKRPLFEIKKLHKRHDSYSKDDVDHNSTRNDISLP